MQYKENTAGLILFNGRVAIGDEGNSIHEAVAIKDGKILKPGTNPEIFLLKDERTELVDLRGRLVIPGLIESHAHFSGAALSEIHGELFIPLSVKELLDYIRKKIETVEKGEWLYFRNTYPVRMEELRFPTIEELDSAAPDNPVYIDGVYAGQANSCALRTAEIDEKTVPIRGKLCRDEHTGKLNGILFSCDYLVKKHISFPHYTDEDVYDAIKILQKNYNRLGITSVIDGSTAARDIKAYNRLYRQGGLGLRLVYTYMAEAIEGIEKETDDLSGIIQTPGEWGKPGFLKVIIDGGILTGTAYMRRPYGKEIGIPGVMDGCFRGVVKMDKEQLCMYIKKACRTGLQMTAHCIGDAATDIFLSAYEEVNKTIPVNNKRFSIIHADFTDSSTLKRIKEMGLVLFSQPAWHYRDGSALNRILDGDVMKTFLPYKNMNDSGVMVCTGSDHMVKHDSFLSQNPYNPFLGMYNLVTRKTCSGEFIQPWQRVSRENALKMYTYNGAYATFDENSKGTLEKGKYADMAVLSKDYFTCTEEEIPLIESELTITGGRIVFGK